MWRFERHERLAELVTQMQGLAEYLHRAACDETDAAGRLALAERQAIVGRRIRRWQAEARAASRNTKLTTIAS